MNNYTICKYLQGLEIIEPIILFIHEKVLIILLATLVFFIFKNKMINILWY